VRLSLSGPTTVRVATLVPRAFEKLGVELDNPPDGVAIRRFTLSQDGVELELEADAARVKPGQRGTLIVTLSGERAPQANQASPSPATRRRLPLATLPAIAFVITK
jgi:hypothetical protein